MASKKNQQTADEGASFIRREVSAILCLMLGLFLYLSLFSFDPHDPSFLSISSDGIIRNWGGMLGSYLADSLLVLFGAGSYLIGFYLFLLSGLLLMGWRDRIGWISIPLYFIFVIFTAVLFQLSMENIRFHEVAMPAGGLFGGMLAHFGITYLGKPGTCVVVILGALSTFVWATRISVREISRGFFQILKPITQFTASRFVIYGARARKSLQRWKEWMKKSGKEKPVFTPDVKVNTAPAPRPVPMKPELSVEELRQKSKPQPAHERAPEPILSPKIMERADKPKPKPEVTQLEFNHMGKGYQPPPLSLLQADSHHTVTIDEESLKLNARLLEKKLQDFDVTGQVTEIHPGPVITMYEFQPAAGVKLSRIAGLVDDLGLAMGGRQVRIVAPLPNKAAVGIEIPNNERETVYLKDIISDERFQKHDSKIPIALGKDIEGIPYVGDMAKMPHLLVAGATGAGKSVSINATILSFLYKSSPEDVRLIMVDPKMLELSIYEGIPHLLLPVVTDAKKANLALRWGVREMERRYKMMADINARNILNYNQKVEKGNFVSRQQEKVKEQGVSVYADDDLIKHEGKLPYIVIIIDELADLMMVAGREVEESIMRLAQMARAAGIHLILATQRPSVDVITGVIKANFPSRIAFKVSSKHDGRTILDSVGAERLLGNGDMLHVPPGASKIIRIHGAFISEEEVSRVVEHIKKQGKPIYDESILKPVEGTGDGEVGENDEEADELYDQAVSIVAETKQASISMIQRKLRVGYNRAARMIERMEGEGIVSPASGAGHRQVLVSSFEQS